MNYEEISVMSFTKVMDKAFNVHKKYIGTSALYLFLFNLIGIVAAFILILAGFSSLGFMANMLNGFSGPNMFEFMDFGAVMAFSSLIIFIFFVIFLFEFTKIVGIADIASKGLLGKKVRFENALGRAFKKIPSTISVIIAYGIIFVPITAIFAALLFNIGFFQEFDPLNIGVISLSIVFVAIYIYLSTIFMFSIYASVVENLYFFKALNKSRILVKNNFWRLLGINILFSLVIIAITYSVYSIFGVIGGLIYILLRGVDINEVTLAALIMVGNFLRLPLQVIVSLFIAPLSYIFYTLLYYNQRFKKEGYDISLKLEALKIKALEEIKKENISDLSNSSIEDSNKREI